MLPILLKVNENYKIKLSAERWNEIKPFVVFKKVQKD
jgi:hypothetical protein